MWYPDDWSFTTLQLELQEENMENKEFVFVISHSYDAIERAAAALQLATNMVAFDAKIDFFLMNEGIHLA